MKQPSQPASSNRQPPDATGISLLPSRIHDHATVSTAMADTNALPELKTESPSNDDAYEHRYSTSADGDSIGPHRGEIRRAKACNYCKSLKVRCIPADDSDPDGICVRCSKGKRECVFYYGPRKKRKTKEK